MLTKLVRGALAALVMIHGAELLAGSGTDRVSPVTVGATFRARDSIRPATDSRPEAERCLRRLCWHAEEFTVRIERPKQEDAGDLWVTFPSPKVDQAGQPGQDAALATVVLEWYPVRDEEGRVCRAPSVVVVHESDSGMTVGRIIARGFRQRGIHAFMIELPGYGARRVPRDVSQVERFGRLLVQAVRDVRRARDAVAILPAVSERTVALQGTSLGGFVAATTAGIDNAFAPVFVLLAGGDLYTVVMTGKRDAEKARQEMLKAGLTEQQIRELAELVEPLRLAHRIDARRFWLFRGKYDTVVPPECSRKLCRAIGLDPRHDVVLPVNHYSGIVFLPATLDFVATRIREAIAAPTEKHGSATGGAD